MLSITGDNGSRLAAIIPRLYKTLSDEHSAVESIILLVVDGLGWHNLKSRSGHARNLLSLDAQKIQTVIPSTTAAALTSLTTGSLPGTHGMTGYRILHEDLGVISALSDWQQISDVRQMQFQETVFENNSAEKISPFIVARSQHATTGFTRGVLTGASYIGVDDLRERFRAALNIVQSKPRSLVYLYVDELDRMGHKKGWESDSWTYLLEDLDSAVAETIDALPKTTGIVVTADHGMLDIDPADSLILEELDPLQGKIRHISGEPRFRHVYLKNPEEGEQIQKEIAQKYDFVQVTTRAGAIEQNLFGPVADRTMPRIGDLLLVPVTKTSFASTHDPIFPISMIGQHGGLTEFERDIPLLSGGALNTTAFNF